MSDFSYTNYHTIYECYGSVGHDMGSDSCFHTVTKDEASFNMDNHYVVRFYKSIEYLRNNSNNNFCPFTGEEIKRYLHILTTYFPFDYSLESVRMTPNGCENTDDYDDDESTYDVYELKLHISGFYMKHKFILKMIRVLYEYPFNMAMVDTMRLMKQEKFRTYGYFNIYMMIGYIFAACAHISVCDDQFVCSIYNGIPKFIKKKELISRLSNTGQVCYDEDDDDDDCGFPKMNSIVDYTGGNGDIKEWLENRFVNSREVTDYSYWTDPEMAEERDALYERLIEYFV